MPNRNERPREAGQVNGQRLLTASEHMDERLIILPNGSGMTITQYLTWRDKTMADAARMIAANERGELTEQQKLDLPDTVQDLRDCLAVQLDATQAIRRRDLRDTNYSNVNKDRVLRYQIRVLRNLDLSLHAPWGSGWMQKISAIFTEDMGNFFGIEYRRIKDHALQLVKVAGAVGTGVAGGVAGAFAGNTLGGPLGAIGGGFGGAVLGVGGGYLALDRWFRSRAHRRYPQPRRGTAGLMFNPALLGA